MAVNAPELRASDEDQQVVRPWRGTQPPAD